MKNHAALLLKNNDKVISALCGEFLIGRWKCMTDVWWLSAPSRASLRIWCLNTTSITASEIERFSFFVHQNQPRLVPRALIACAASCRRDKVCNNKNGRSVREQLSKTHKLMHTLRHCRCQCVGVLAVAALSLWLSRWVRGCVGLGPDDSLDPGFYDLVSLFPSLQKWNG